MFYAFSCTYSIKEKFKNINNFEDIYNFICSTTLNVDLQFSVRIVLFDLLNINQKPSFNRY